MCPTRSEKFRTYGNFGGQWPMADVKLNPWTGLEAVEDTCDQQRLGWNCTDVQANLSVCWSHKFYCRFCCALAPIFSLSTDWIRAVLPLWKHLHKQGIHTSPWNWNCLPSEKESIQTWKTLLLYLSTLPFRSVLPYRKANRWSKKLSPLQKFCIKLYLSWYSLINSYSFVETDHEIFSTVILSLPLIQEGQLSVSGERMCTILVNRLEDLACPVNV